MVCATLICLLAACSRDSRATDIKQCIAKVGRDASQGRLSYALGTAENAEDRHDKMGAVVVSCMEEEGYQHDAGAMADARCVDDLDFNPYCYRRGN